MQTGSKREAVQAACLIAMAVAGTATVALASKLPARALPELAEPVAVILWFVGMAVPLKRDRPEVWTNMLRFACAALAVYAATLASYLATGSTTDNGTRAVGGALSCMLTFIMIAIVGLDVVALTATRLSACSADETPAVPTWVRLGFVVGGGILSFTYLAPLVR
jgi:hypothetical protein